MPWTDDEIDESYPKVKHVKCLFCLTPLTLLRRGRIKSNGMPDFYYLEDTYIEDWSNHECVGFEVWGPRLGVKLKKDEEDERTVGTPARNAPVLHQVSRTDRRKADAQGMRDVQPDLFRHRS